MLYKPAYEIVLRNRFMSGVAHMHVRGLLLTAALFLVSHPGRTQESAPARSGRSSAETATPKQPAGRTVVGKLSPAREKWVVQTLNKMMLDEKIGQLLLVTYYGGFISSESDAYRELVHQVDQNHVGGFIVVTRGSPLGIVESEVYPTAVLANQLQRHAKIPLLIAADFERGTALRLREGTSFPDAMAVAAAGTPKDAYTMGRITALEARAAGVHWIFAPVADVNSNPDNPIINIRSFGEDSQRVAEFVSAFVRGVEENGALATAKHFPGHGDTASDSHLDLPVVYGDRKRLDSVELVPFRAAIEAGVSSIMTAHLAVPAIEPDRVPATLSPRILTDLLRKDLGFNGLVVTDALNMGGVTRIAAPGEAAVRSFLAGADVLLMPPVPDAAFEALKTAVRTGRIPRSRLDESVRRILRAKARLGLHRERLVPLEGLNAKFGLPDWSQAAQEMSDRGVTLLRDTTRQLPLDATRPARALLVVIAGDPDPYPGADLEDEIRPRVDSLQVVRADTRFARVSAIHIPPPETYDVAIAALFVRVVDRKGTIGLPEDQSALLNQLFASGKPVVVVGFGNPYLIERFPNSTTWLAVFGNSDVSQRSAARALFGQVAISGRLPVGIPGLEGGGLKAGEGLAVPANPMRLWPASDSVKARLKPAFDVVERAVANGTLPGGVLAVGHHGQLVVHPFGRQIYGAQFTPERTGAIDDLGSLGESLVTAFLLARLTETSAEGAALLDAPIERYLPEWPSGPSPEWRHKVTIRHLLTHRSGFPAHLGASRTFSTRSERLATVLAEPLATEPGTKEIYSPLGFILLGEIIERMTGKPLGALAEQQLFVPLQMKDSTYRPGKGPLAQVGPAESPSTHYQRRSHAERAFPIGGIAGHAGLLSTASELAAFSQMLLNGGIYAHHRFLRRSTIVEFTGPQPLLANARTLGGAAPGQNSPSGHYFSPRSFGETDYTGSWLWIDPAKDLFVILLKNRVSPGREDHKAEELLPAVHEAVIEALGLGPVQPTSGPQGWP